LLYALGSPDVSRVVVAAHDAAVAAAFGYLEREAGFVRRGHGGLLRERGAGLVGAAFRHRTSRATDPQLHTHVLLANLVATTDGEWRAVTSKAFYRHAHAAGALYRAALREALTRELGVGWRARSHGLYEIAGLPSRMLRAFSRRRMDIEQALDERGHSSAQAASVATLATRPGKVAGQDGLRLREQWQQRADELGFGTEIERVLGTTRQSGRATAPQDSASPVTTLPNTLPNTSPANDRPLDELTCHRLTRDLFGPDGITAHSSTFRRRDLLRAVCDRLPDGAPAADVQAFTERLLNHAEIVRLAGEPGPGSRFDEREVFTTRELLALEQHVLDAARTGRATQGSHVPPALLEIALRNQPALSAEQLRMVDQLCRSGNLIDAIMGAPGSGKTRALAAAHAGWRASGLPVLGASVKATAAAELQAGSGIPATTVARLLLDADQSDPATGYSTGLPQYVVLVVDEAGMLGSRQLARLLAHVRRAEGKLVLVGDPNQLPSIEAGGLFALLAAELQAVRLTGNQRQTDQADRQALRDYRDNDIPSALSSDRARGRLQTHPTAAQQKTAMITAWWNDHLAGVPSVMLAYRRRDIRALNDLARQHMITAGNLTGPELKVSDEELGERAFQTGDHVLFRRNDYPLGVRNGQRGRIQQIDPISDNLLVTLEGNPTPVLLPAGYVARSLDHGYALTIHASQGLTIQRTHVLGNDALFYEAGLVALSRHRDTCHLYITEDLDADPSRETTHIPQDSLDISKRLEISRADRAALDHVRGGR
jgi:hypothetical protein